jgi:D-3-phosphoglycerate dehydrogenase / 2-oxoglutarate reductase
MSIKVVYTDYYYDSVQIEFDLLKSELDVEIVDLTKVVPGGIKEPADLIPHLQGADALVTQFARITSEVMDAMPGCRVIARHAIGLDTIDLEAAHQRGIAVANVPDYCIEEVSDTAMAHILNAARRVSESAALLMAGRWSYAAISPLTRIAEQTVGLLAFGNIARRVADKLQPYGCRIIAHDINAEPDQKYRYVELVDMDTLLAQSDIFSIHVPLGPQTHHMIDAQAFTRMKKGVVIVNTSRGGVIDQVALTAALKSGQVRFAGLDVLEEADAEYASSPMLELGERVAVSPHVSWYSEESIRDLKTKTARNVIETFTRGNPLYQAV